MTFNPNDTDISDHKCVFTSDPEGYDIMQMIPTDQAKGFKHIFLCGDILDSTFLLPVQMFTNDTLNYMKLKSNNLKNIFNIIRRDSCIRFVYGNRDLNKLKCRYLTELEHVLINTEKFNGNKIDLSQDSYNMLIAEIRSTKKLFKADSPFAVKDMNSWYTFWSADPSGKGKKWNENNYHPSAYDYPFLLRFFEIFGADNSAILGGDNECTKSAVYHTDGTRTYES